jgi:hypothetical protein
MIARLVCLFRGHDYTTIAWAFRSKTWSVKECLRCRKQKRNAQIPPRPMPGPPLRVVVPKVPASYVDPPMHERMIVCLGCDGRGGLCAGCKGAGWIVRPARTTPERTFR